MERHAFALEIRENCRNSFRTLLKKIWPDTVSLLDRIQADNCSLWNIEDLVFGYLETEQTPEISADLLTAYTEREQKILPYARFISRPLEGMRLMYEDFGIVRKDKSLIRHRVFITRLKPGMQEEYKARHDRLIEARNGKITEGPDSNFSIWNAEDYIFGYDEIDVTMEKEETEASRAASIAWETRMLEIMDWYTDDVDWISHQRHGHIIRLAHYRH